jgi:hypothetical protein
MERFGNFLTELGLKIIPYSFLAYFPARWFCYKWEMGYSLIVKSIWYCALGSMYIFNDVEINQVVMYICFIESWDLFIQQLEINKKRKNK